ncbi:MAG: EMC3/TMCO1 family protein [Candidatus Aenigmatarchaeota archaeon]
MSLIGLPIFIEEILASALITFLITVIYRFLGNQSDMRQLKIDMKEKQSKIKEVQKTNPQEANRIMNEVMVLTNKQMKMNMKPMMLTLVVVSLALPYFPNFFPGDVVSLPLSLPYFGDSFGWLMWYFIVSIPFGYGFRKILGVEQ